MVMMMRAYLAGVSAALCATGIARAACPSAFETGPTSDACFLVSEETATFTQCEAYCETQGSLLASIRTEEEYEWVAAWLAEDATIVYIGLFEAGADESGDWQWVDGSDASAYVRWEPGEPNEWCTDEDCAVFGPTVWTDGWADVSCTLEDTAQCLCRYDGSSGVDAAEPSDAYYVKAEDLDANDNEYEGCWRKYYLDQLFNNSDADLCAKTGFGSEAFTPDVVPYPGATCQDASDDTELAWAWCCCGYPEYCCPDGVDVCTGDVPSGDDDDAFSGSAENCPEGFGGPAEDACFYVSDEERSFVQCEEEICEPLGATLASIRSAEEEAYLTRVVGDRLAYIGGFEAGRDESGNWKWVDGGDVGVGTYAHWGPGQPDNACVDEDCLLFAPSLIDGWADVSCGLDAGVVCVCRSGEVPSWRYENMRDILADAATSYDECTNDDDFYQDDDVSTTTDDAYNYCEAHGFDATSYTPFAVAYPPANPSRPEVTPNGKYTEGQCGFASYDRDDRWARCCCGDRTYCCPDGLDVAWCKVTHEDSSSDACPYGYAAPPSEPTACFKVSTVAASFVNCQTEVCGKEGATLASIRNEAEFEFVQDLLMDAGDYGAFIGLFEYGEDESGDWRNVDGSPATFQKWKTGEPDNWCVDEDCVFWDPLIWRNWIDASCTFTAQCVCRADTTPSSEFYASVDALNRADAYYDGCGDYDAGGESASKEDEEEEEQEDEILDRMTHVESMIVALLVIFCLLLAAGLVAVGCLVKRQWAAMKALGVPAYSIELGGATRSPLAGGASYAGLASGDIPQHRPVV